MENIVSKTGNGYHKPDSSKNRLRIQGMAVLERENQPNVTASYDYTTFCPNDFFEEDGNELQFFELNKIAMGMTIYKKDQKLKNGSNENGKGVTSLALQNYNGTVSDPVLTDVIWSRMDITNPHANRNAYIIKQYYNSKLQQCRSSRVQQKCNSFACGFVSCCVMMSVGCALAFFCQSAFMF